MNGYLIRGTGVEAKAPRALPVCVLAVALDRDATGAAIVARGRYVAAVITCFRWRSWAQAGHSIEAANPDVFLIRAITFGLEVIAIDAGLFAWLVARIGAAAGVEPRARRLAQA